MVNFTHNKRNANQSSTEYHFSFISLAKIQKLDNKLVYKVVGNVHSYIANGNAKQYKSYDADGEFNNI